MDEVLEASIMIENGISIKPSIFTFPTVKPINKIFLQDISKKYDLIVTVEEHNIVGGFGSSISEIISTFKGKKPQMVHIGINDQYSSIVGSQSYLRAKYSIDALSIFNTVKDNI